MIFGEGESAGPLGGKQPVPRQKPEWTDFRGYFAAVLKKVVATNIGTYVGSSQIWTLRTGETPVRHPPPN